MKKLIGAFLCVILSMNFITAAENDTILIEGVPVIKQFPELPTGCEVTSLAMLLNFYDIKIDKLGLAEDMPKGLLPAFSDGALIGGNPNELFVGSPYSESGFGVYHQPMLELLEAYMPGRSVNLTGTNLETLFQSIDSGHPVLVWATIPYNGGLLDVEYTYSWKTNYGSVINWMGNEHVMVLTGYSINQGIVYLNDPYNGQEIQIKISEFEDKWLELGQQAITVNDGFEYDHQVTRFTNFENYLKFNNIKVSSNSEVFHYRRLFKKRYIVDRF